jgi:hypothetical protein
MDQRAVVDFNNQRYELPSKRMSIGKRYTNSSATLIIDGDFAVFATTDEEHHLECRQVNAR